MSKWERKFGKYAIPNLTIVLLGCYVVGYLLEWLAPAFMNCLTLNPYAILHGQVWRVITWVIAPPTTLSNYSDLFFVIIMLMFYFSLGTSLERVWGTWQYNVYIFTGILFTIISSFICMGIFRLIAGPLSPEFNNAFYQTSALMYSTYYINMSIFLAYALTFPNAQVLLMFIIPVKVKWLGILYGVMLVLEMAEYFKQGLTYFSIGGAAYWFRVAAIAASLVNFLVFWLRSRNRVHLGARQIKRKVEFKQDIRKNPRITKHKCAICGQSESDNPDLEFRFCSKCNGNYEYCQNHLFTHEHVK